MIRAAVIVGFGLAASPALAEQTEWGQKVAAASADAPFLVPPATPYVDPSLRPIDGPVAAIVPADLRAVAAIGSRWGTVTSLTRSVAHNRKVGGVVNSYHLSGRAMDVARRPGVRHAQIAADLRKAGYALVESLDEGDHSHFAFGAAAAPAKPAKPRLKLVNDRDTTHWRAVIAAPGGGD